MSDDSRGVLLYFGERVVRAVLDGLRGESVESIFVSGSGARGDVAGFEQGGVTEVYSDLDLYVVLRDPADLEEARRRARRAAALVPREGKGYRIYPEPDVGVFSEQDFLSQKVRPGTVEIAASHLLLHGSGEIPLLAREFAASAIDASEGLYLLENRLMEITGLERSLDEESAEGFRRYVFYVLCKSCLDAVSALLIVLGRFDASREERMKRFESEVVRGKWVGLVRDGDAERIRRCHAYVVGLQETIENGAEAASDLGDGVESVLLGAWRAAATRISGVGGGDWARLVEWRCKRARWTSNLRELAVLGRRIGIPRTRLLTSMGRLARLSPVDALRLSGAVGALLRRTDEVGPCRATRRGIEEGYVAFIDDLTRAFGDGEGPVFARAHRLFKETA